MILGEEPEVAHWPRPLIADMAEQDLYAILEVKKTASVDEIRRSYQGLAKQVPVNKINKLC